MLEKARKQIDGGSLERYAAEIAEHKRDPYSLVEEIVRAQNAHRFDGGRASPPVQPAGRAALHRKNCFTVEGNYGIQH